MLSKCSQILIRNISLSLWIFVHKVLISIFFFYFHKNSHHKLLHRNILQQIHSTHKIPLKQQFSKNKKLTPEKHTTLQLKPFQGVKRKLRLICHKTKTPYTLPSYKYALSFYFTSPKNGTEEREKIRVHRQVANKK